MTTPNAPADTSPAPSTDIPAGAQPVPVPPSRRWLLAALLFFVPALVALAVGSLKLWRERPDRAGGGTDA
jgi:hypothetical protein